FEDARLIDLRDADSGIRNRKNDIGVAQIRAHHDASAWKRVLNRIVKQVLQDFGEAPPVSRNVWQVTGKSGGHFQVFVYGTVLGCLQAALDKFRNAHASNLYLQPVGIHLRELQQIVRQSREPPGVLQNNAEEALAILWIVDRSRQQRFRKALDGGKRRFEFMRDVGDE